jgi:integrase
MISKNELRDWLDEDARKQYAKKLEKVFDESIKRNALNGKTTFYISTGRVNNAARTHEKTGFYEVWHTSKLSDVNRKKVKREVLEKYRQAGFDIQFVREDCGWNSSYDAVQFKDIHKVLE